MAGSIYDKMMGTPHLDTSAGTSALNSAASAFQGMASTFNTMRQSIIDEEQKNLQREMEKQHHKEEMDYKDRSLAQADRHHTEDTEFNRWKAEGDWRQKELDRANQLQIAGMRTGGGGGGGGRGRKKAESFDPVASSNAREAGLQAFLNEGSDSKASSPKKETVQAQKAPISAPVSSTQSREAALSSNSNPNKSAADSAASVLDVLTSGRTAIKAPEIPQVEASSSEQVKPNASSVKPSISAPVSINANKAQPKTSEQTSAQSASSDLFNPDYLRQFKPDTFDEPEKPVSDAPEIPRPMSDREMRMRNPLGEKETKKDINLSKQRDEFLKAEGLVKDPAAMGLDEKIGRFLFSGKGVPENMDEALFDAQQDFNSKSRDEQARIVAQNRLERDPEYQKFMEGFDETNPAQFQYRNNLLSSAYNKAYRDIDALFPSTTPKTQTREKALELASEPTKEELEATASRVRGRSIEAAKAEASGETALSVPTQTEYIDLDPNAKTTAEQIFNSNGNFANVSKENIKALINNPQGAAWRREVDVRIARKDKGKSIDIDKTDKQIANYVGGTLTKASQQDKIQMYKMYSVLSQVYRGTELGRIYRGIAEGVRTSLDLAVRPDDRRYQTLVMGATYRALNGTDEHVYGRIDEATKSVRAEQQKTDKDLGLQSPTTVDKSVIDSLKGSGNLESDDRGLIHDNLRDHYANPIVQNFFKKNGESYRTDKVAATAFRLAMRDTWNRILASNSGVFGYDLTSTAGIQKFFAASRDKYSDNRVYRLLRDNFDRYSKALMEGRSVNY